MLVIILLVTAPLLTQSVHVKLPKTAKTTADMNAQPLQLGIDAQGAITINNNPIADLAALEIALKAELANNPDFGVHIYADQAVVYAKFAEVMATIQHTDIAKLSLLHWNNKL